VNALEIARKTYELLSDKKKWAKGDFAMTDDEFQVETTSPNATCFCMLGAIEHVTGIQPYSINTSEPVPPEIDRVVATIAEIVGYEDAGASAVMDYNDSLGRQHRSIVRTLRLTVERLEKEEKRAA